MEIHLDGEVWEEVDGEMVFIYSKMIIRGKNNQLFLATSKLRVHEASALDLERLDKTAIHPDIFQPLYSAGLLRAPTPVAQDSYIKVPNLINIEENLTEPSISKLVLHEIEALELLRKHPHPNIVEYRGCVVTDGRVSGLCLAKYKETLEERMKVGTPFDKDIFLDGIERGIRHLHSLDIVHNDINPSNIMLDELDRPVIIDFDGWQKNGQKLGTKKGTPGWRIEGAKYVRFENDFYGLSKIREFLRDPSSRDPFAELTSANASQASTSATTSTRGPRDVTDSLTTTPELPVEGDEQNTTIQPSPKEKEEQYKYWGWGKQKAGPEGQSERQCMLI
ncbi:hypothetical protein E4U13_002530 [Claviceps humidiphila]|uniref:Protein kinase domain-containing protein n=1 Tax=Claviceps humidiphila TaxID=1294629 RepID=A0A9P7Q8V1_9HYPO|nr:hypothetical protein E4U13_002530 [Claviceps humidiphila]